MKKIIFSLILFLSGCVGYTQMPNSNYSKIRVYPQWDFLLYNPGWNIDYYSYSPYEYSLRPSYRIEEHEEHEHRDYRNH